MVEKSSTLYTDALLRLSSSSFRMGALTEPCLKGRAHSRLCGSHIQVTLILEDNFEDNKNKRIADYAYTIEACALGQATAALLAQNIVGKTWAQIAQGYRQTQKMLSGRGIPKKPWEFLGTMESTKDYPSRHGAILLGFQAIESAILEKEKSREGKMNSLKKQS